MTNFERIKNMTVEEMYKFLVKINTNRMCYGEGFRNLPSTKGLSYNDEIKKWLESEAD